MTCSDMKYIIKKVLKDLNKVKVNGYTFYQAATTHTSIIDIQEVKENVFNIELYTDELKFGGIDDDDDNDALMEDELMEAICEELRPEGRSFKNLNSNQ